MVASGSSPLTPLTPWSDHETKLPAEFLKANEMALPSVAHLFFFGAPTTYDVATLPLRPDAVVKGFALPIRRYFLAASDWSVYPPNAKAAESPRAMLSVSLPPFSPFVPLPASAYDSFEPSSSSVQ